MLKLKNKNLKKKSNNITNSQTHRPQGDAVKLSSLKFFTLSTWWLLHLPQKFPNPQNTREETHHFLMAITLNRRRNTISTSLSSCLFEIPCILIPLHHFRFHYIRYCNSISPSICMFKCLMCMFCQIRIVIMLQNPYCMYTNRF